MPRTIARYPAILVKGRSTSRLLPPITECQLNKGMHMPRITLDHGIGVVVNKLLATRYFKVSADQGNTAFYTVVAVELYECAEQLWNML
jgi:hypothetical protein